MFTKGESDTGGDTHRVGASRGWLRPALIASYPRPLTAMRHRVGPRSGNQWTASRVCSSARAVVDPRTSAKPWATPLAYLGSPDPPEAGTTCRL